MLILLRAPNSYANSSQSQSTILTCLITIHSTIIVNMLVPLAHHTHMAIHFIPPYLYAHIIQNSEHHSYSHAHIIQTTCSQSCSLHSQSCSYYSDHHTHSHTFIPFRTPYSQSCSNHTYYLEDGTTQSTISHYHTLCMISCNQRFCLVFAVVSLIGHVRAADCGSSRECQDLENLNKKLVKSVNMIPGFNVKCKPNSNCTGNCKYVYYQGCSSNLFFRSVITQQKELEMLIN